ncbi:MAG: DapH/DapD/GlmU-related protein, partial [Pseudomonadota bacterium]
EQERFEREGQTWLDRVQVIQQHDRLGTGHAARIGLAGFSDLDQARLLIVYGDTPLVRPETLHSLAKANETITVLGFKTDPPHQYARLIIDDQGQLERIIEACDLDASQQQLRLCNAGLMGADLAAFKTLQAHIPQSQGGEYYLTELPYLAGQHALSCGYRTGRLDELQGVNDLAQLSAAEQSWQRSARHDLMRSGVIMHAPDTVILHYDTVIEPGAMLEANLVFGPGVVIHAHAQIRAFSHLEGAIVHEHARIGPFARLRPGTIIGEKARIGNFVEIKNSKIGCGTTADHLTYLGDSWLEDRVKIGAGTISCNYDGIAKWQTRIGQGSFVGSNSTLVAPLSIGEDCLIAAGSIVVEDSPDSHLVIARTRQQNKPGGMEARRTQFRQRAQASTAGSKPGKAKA